LGRWLRLPSRGALILGLGALPTTALQADAPEQNTPTSFGNVLMRTEGGKIYLSEGGKKFQELQLRDSAEARFLKQLLEQNGTATAPAGLLLNPTIFAGGGGTGFSWWNIKKSATDKPAPTLQDPSQVTAPPSRPDQGSAPREQNPVTEKRR
jgi:hypothetical protein